MAIRIMIAVKRVNNEVLVVIPVTSEGKKLVDSLELRDLTTYFAITDSMSEYRAYLCPVVALNIGLVTLEWLKDQGAKHYVDFSPAGAERTYWAFAPNFKPYWAENMRHHAENSEWYSEIYTGFPLN